MCVAFDDVCEIPNKRCPQIIRIYLSRTGGNSDRRIRALCFEVLYRKLNQLELLAFYDSDCLNRPYVWDENASLNFLLAHDVCFRLTTDEGVKNRLVQSLRDDMPSYRAFVDADWVVGLSIFKNIELSGKRRLGGGAEAEIGAGPGSASYSATG